MKANQPLQKQMQPAVTTTAEAKATLNPLQLKTGANTSFIRIKQNPLQAVVDKSAKPNNNPLQLRSKKENTTGLPDKLKENTEALSGFSMADVQVHYNSDKPAQLQALAYTQGTDIHIAPGQEKHLPHEAWHVVQQKQGRVKATMQMKGSVAVNDDESLEKEADVMGAKAMQTNHPGRQVQTLTNMPVSPGIAQLRIGFEVETGIPITRRKLSGSDYIYEDAHPQTMKQNVRQGTLIISADHTAEHKRTITEPFDQWSIIEGVTDPIDDSLSVKQFEAIAKVWLNTLITIKQLAKSAPPAKQLMGGSKYYVGLPSKQQYDDWDRIAPQVTVGVPLDQVAKIISRFPLSGKTSAFNATKFAQQAPAKATSVMQKLIHAIPPGHSGGVAELKGLITLMLNYLTAGNDDAIAGVIYMKNRPANVFYKSKLSDVRNNLLNTSYGNQVLSNEDNRKVLRKLLLKESGRISKDPLFKADPRPPDTVNVPPEPRGMASTVKVGTWINQILTGVNDKIFDEMKNPWAKKIAPDAYDEVVIELRKIGFNLTHFNYKLEDFNNGLLNYLTKVYIANKAIKNKVD